MSKIESKMRIFRRTTAYRKISLVVNICFLVIICLLILYGCMFSFTKKRDYRDQGVKHFNDGNYTEAIECFDKALECDQIFSDKLNVDIQLYKGESYLHLYDYVFANQVYKDILNYYSSAYYDEEDIKYMVDVTDNLILFDNGEYEKCVEALSTYVNDGYTELALYVAICYEQLGDVANMKNYYDIYHERFGLNSYLAFKYAQYYIYLEDYENALKYIQDGLSLSDSEYKTELEYLEIVSYSELSQYDYAYKLASQYVLLYPEDIRGMDIYEYLYTRVNPYTTPISDKFEETYIEEVY